MVVKQNLNRNSHQTRLSSRMNGRETIMCAIVLNKLNLYWLSKILNILAKRHTEWLRMASSFKINNEDANEIVQEMYIRMHDYTKDIERIMYNEKEINTFSKKYIKNKKTDILNHPNLDDIGTRDNELEMKISKKYGSSPKIPDAFQNDFEESEQEEQE